MSVRRNFTWTNGSYKAGAVLAWTSAIKSAYTFETYVYHWNYTQSTKGLLFCFCAPLKIVKYRSEWLRPTIRNNFIRVYNIVLQYGRTSFLSVHLQNPCRSFLLLPAIRSGCMTFWMSNDTETTRCRQVEEVGWSCTSCSRIRPTWMLAAKLVRLLWMRSTEVSLKKWLVNDTSTASLYLSASVPARSWLTSCPGFCGCTDGND